MMADSSTAAGSTSSSSSVSASSPSPVPVMTVEEKIAKGKEQKDIGNQAFKNGDNQAALRSYHNAVLYLSGLDSSSMNGIVGNQKELEQSLKDDIMKTLATCHNNIAAVHIRNQKWDRAITYCNKVLEKQPENSKALFRRGQSNLALNNLDAAEADLVKAAKLEPKDAAIRGELAKIKKRREEYAEKQKKEWKGMFDREKK
ncbi:hypothetical protein DFJ73DRAFT_839688 [Zopfochytrium polystomum]|nr:hypothetical protein DFJ73DRAFT_839688 [Zopfochytrium polystomum]